MLTISRPGIEHEFLQDFGNEAMLKLPIQNYMEMLPDQTGKSNAWEQITTPQVALINAINNPAYRFVCAAICRRLGKTYIANIIAQMMTLIPNYNVLIIAPNYNLSGISFELQRKLIRNFDLEMTRDNVKDRVIELANGSTIRTGSIAQVDSCVGRSYNLIVYDEAALSKDGEESFNIALRPTLDIPGSKAIFISTPRGKKNWFSGFFDRGFSPEFPEWASIHADYHENPRMSEKDVNEARKSMSKNEFEQEYMASFTTFKGQIYADYNHDNTIWEAPPIEEMEIFGGLDPGYRDPTAFVVVGYHYATEKYYVLDEYEAAEKVTKDHAAAMQILIDKYNVENIFIDSAAAQFSQDLAYTYDISTSKSKKQVLEGIAYVQNIVQQDTVKIMGNCLVTLDMIDQYQWDPNENLTKEKPVHNEYSHMADALRYALYSFTV